MGNPKGVTVAKLDQADPIEHDKGIFAMTPGHITGGASRQLPPPETMRGQTASVIVDGEWLGQVRITYVSQLMRHRRTSHWAWIAHRVDREPTP